MRHAAVLALLLLAPVLLATQSPQPPLFRSGINLVDVAVLVSDEAGRFVPGLTATDFAIAERGVPQRITVFDRISIPVWHAEPGEAALPVAMPIDTSSLAPGRYVLRMRLAPTSTPQSERVVPFEVVAGQSHETSGGPS